MKIRRFGVAVAGLSLIAGAALAGQASAGVQGEPEPGAWPIGKPAAKLPQTKAQAAGPCKVLIGGVDATGEASATELTATKPPTAGGPAPFQLFPVRASSTWYYVKGGVQPPPYYAGIVLQGANLYIARATFVLDAPGAASSTKLGTGWSGFSTIATSNYVQGPKAHGFLYGLHANGSLYRYDLNTGVKPLGSAPGYQGFRAITVISETATYDTLLATTKAGALWTIRIPVTAPFKATLKLVRSTGFKGYDQLVAQRCGASSTLLTGLNKANNKATLYAMSRANGTATVINTIGNAEINSEPGVRFLRTNADGPQLVGE
ncbi:hypothetical protein AB0P21_30630 [Kribbella sp. NPDC056861]|uniref:hypothetical protein n=1 Tax=Kribbella sp. NPDC056861 TaxID=3154857 RepID=UPI00342FF993